MKYSKPPLSFQDQITLWQSRGLIVTDVQEAIHHLKYIGYYRLSAYTLPFQLPKSTTGRDHIFKDNIRFADVLRLYRFDCELRFLVMRAIEKIEVAFRTAFSNVMCLNHGAFWYAEKGLFADDFDHAGFIEKINGEIGANGAHSFLRHYFQTYSDPTLPPSWMTIEATSFSRWSKSFPCLKYRDDKKEIAAVFSLSWETLNSWIHSIAHVRNICAHHSRLWNRIFVITPTLADHPQWKITDNKKFYAQAAVMGFFMKQIAKGERWNEKLLSLIEDNPHVDRLAMGFPKRIEIPVVDFQI